MIYTSHTSNSEIEIAAFIHDRKIIVHVHRTILETNEWGNHQVQLYSSANTDTSDVETFVFHIVHYVGEDGGHYVWAEPFVLQAD